MSRNVYLHSELLRGNRSLFFDTMLLYWRQIDQRADFSILKVGCVS